MSLYLVGGKKVSSGTYYLLIVDALERINSQTENDYVVEQTERILEWLGELVGEID